MIIGILDSGLGAIAVLKKLLSKNKLATYIVYLDNKHLPYGNKNDAELRKYLSEAMSFFYKQNCDLVIIACNTISTVFNELDYLNQNVITPIKLVNKVINEHPNCLVLATNKTIEKKVYSSKGIACSNWASQIESGLVDINKYTNDFTQSTKTIILACTHYSFLKNYLEKKYPNKQFIDSVELIATNVNIIQSPLKISFYINK